MWLEQRRSGSGGTARAAQVLHETKGIPRDIDFLAEADARISAVRSDMGEEAWDEAWRRVRR